MIRNKSAGYGLKFYTGFSALKSFIQNIINCNWASYFNE